MQKVNRETFTEIKSIYKEYEKAADEQIGKQYNLSESTVRRVRKAANWVAYKIALRGSHKSTMLDFIETPAIGWGDKLRRKLHANRK